MQDVKNVHVAWVTKYAIIDALEIVQQSEAKKIQDCFFAMLCSTIAFVAIVRKTLVKYNAEKSIVFKTANFYYTDALSTKSK